MISCIRKPLSYVMAEMHISILLVYGQAIEFAHRQLIMLCIVIQVLKIDPSKGLMVKWVRTENVH